MATSPGSGALWHLIERPRAPFRCDVCGAAIPEAQWDRFTTLSAMYYDTPPPGCTPCNRALPGLRAVYTHTVLGHRDEPA